MLTVVLPIACFPAGVLILVGINVIEMWPITLEKLYTLSSCLKITVDAISIFSWVSWAYFILHLQFLFLEKLNFTLKHEIKQVRLENVVLNLRAWMMSALLWC